MFVQSHQGRIITKYHFNEVFAKAWLKSMVPANIISGFKTCGICPFNPKAVLDHDPTKEKSTEVDTLSITSSQGKHSTSEAATFTAEEEALFVRRYNNGYNIPDPRYVELNHPEDRLIDHFENVTPLELCNMDSGLPPVTEVLLQSLLPCLQKVQA